MNGKRSSSRATRKDPGFSRVVNKFVDERKRGPETNRPGGAPREALLPDAPILVLSVAYFDVQTSFKAGFTSSHQVERAALAYVKNGVWIVGPPIKFSWTSLVGKVVVRHTIYVPVEDWDWVAKGFILLCDHGAGALDWFYQGHIPPKIVKAYGSTRSLVSSTTVIIRGRSVAPGSTSIQAFWDWPFHVIMVSCDGPGISGAIGLFNFPVGIKVIMDVVSPQFFEDIVIGLGAVFCGSCLERRYSLYGEYFIHVANSRLPGVEVRHMGGEYLAWIIDREAARNVFMRAPSAVYGDDILPDFARLSMRGGVPPSSLNEF